jgi:hypothetical protein
MGCSGVLSFFPRPYIYNRRPLKLASGEIFPIASGAIWSQPAYAALTDKRLWTDADSHPVNTPILLYVNKDTADTIPIDPDPTASGYPSGCVNYVDYITDIRSVLEDVYALQAIDSEHNATAFKISHLRRNRAPYGDLNLTSASGTLDTDYIHGTPATMFPSGEELGASGIHDIDIDEIAYQAMARPSKFQFTNFKAVTRRIPTSPIFPIVVKRNGGVPSISTLTASKFDQQGLDISSSGNKLLITGDRLTDDVSIKVMSSNSGSSILDTKSWVQNIDGAAYPAGAEMCRYLQPSGAASGYITASGRQALFNVPSIGSTGVYLIVVSENTETSGTAVQHFPADWESLGGLKGAGTTSSAIHRGLYVENKLLYTLADISDEQLVIGRSLNTGKKVFGHIADAAKNILGKGLAGGGDVSYIDNNKIYVFADILSRTQEPAGVDVGGNPKFEIRSSLSWATANSLLTASFETGNSTDLRETHGLRAWHVGSIPGGGNFGIQLVYIQWGIFDYFVRGTSNTSTPGFTVENIRSIVRSYNHTTDSGGNLVLVERPESPETINQNLPVFASRFKMFNLFTLLISRNFFIDVVRVNGDFYYQFGDFISPTIIRRGRILTKPTTFSTVLIPPTTRTVRTVSIGFFPNWALRTYITTNNQIEIPDTVTFSSVTISNDAGMTKFADGDVEQYGPPAWDSSTGVNYLYVKLKDATGTNQFWFCTMNTSFKITSAKPVLEEDVILKGPVGFLDL